MKRTRSRAVERAERLLLRRARPRLLMSLLLVLTGSAGFLVSYGLLRVGLERMWLRYPLAILAAYGVFLLLLRAWLAAQGRRRQQSSGFDLDPTGLDVHLGGLPGGGPRDFGFGGGGDFAGGGAGGGWTELGGEGGRVLGSAALSPADATPGVPGGGSFAVASGPSSGGSSGGLLDSLNVDLDLDGEGCAVVVALAAVALAVLAGLVVSIYVVYAAPALLAEILVDGLLVAGLYKRMKGVERRHWLRAAVRRTCLPVALALASFAAAGYAMQWAVPEARTVGEFWRAIAG